MTIQVTPAKYICAVTIYNHELVLLKGGQYFRLRETNNRMDNII
jgi:hypothetical protein